MKKAITILGISASLLFASVAFAADPFQYDALAGSQTLQSSFYGIEGTIQLPTNVVYGPGTVWDSTKGAWVTNDDYTDWYFNLHNYVEGGVSYSSQGWKVFLNTGYWPSGQASAYWNSYPISQKGLNFGFGSTIRMKLINHYTYAEMFVDDGRGFKLIYSMPIYQNAVGYPGVTSDVGYITGLKDQFHYMSVNTSTWSNLNLIQRPDDSIESPWTATGWGYSPVRKNDSKFGIYTAHPLSCYYN